MLAMDDQGFLLLEDVILFLSLKCIYMEIGIHLNVLSLNSLISYLGVLKKKVKICFSEHIYY